MIKIELKKRIEHFSSMATIIAPLCSTYNNQAVKPFIEAAQIYNENYRSGIEFESLLEKHRTFMKDSIRLCNKLFDNYIPSKQNSIYDWSKSFFNVLNASKKIIDEAYKLAYTVGRDDITTKTIIENEKNPLVKIKRRYILTDGEFETYKKNMFDWRCGIQSLYVEEQYMKHIVELCNSRKSKFDPSQAKITGGNIGTCQFPRVIEIYENSTDSTPQICVLNAELLLKKHQIDKAGNNINIVVISEYLQLYARYQYELISFVFTNFTTLYQEMCVQCLRVFLEQQHSIMFNLLQKQKKLISEKEVEDEEKRRINDITWNDINKNAINSTCGLLNGSDPDPSCNQTKLVGSLL